MKLIRNKKSAQLNCLVKVIDTLDPDSCNCRCLICGKEFISIEKDHFNMKLVECPTCGQQVWVPKCPNGCPSFKEKEK